MQLVFLLTALMLFVAPLVRGSNRPVAIAALLALCGAVLAALMAQFTVSWLMRRQANSEAPPFKTPVALPRWWWWATGMLVLSPVWLGVLYLLPWGTDTWSGLAGRLPYVQAWQVLGQPTPAHLALSLNPHATWAAVLSAWPMAVAFAVALLAPRRWAETGLRVLLAAGGLQLVVAVLQVAQGPQSVLYFGLGGGAYVGTFANRNHLADFVGMLLPVWFFVWVRSQHHTHSHGRQWLPPTFFKPLWWLLGFSWLVLVLGTQSRGGLISLTVVMLAMLTLYARTTRRHFSGRQKLLALLAVLAFLAVAYGFAERDALEARFAQAQLKTDAEYRNTFALATWQGAQALWPWGSGPGTFESVFPRFQPMLSPDYVDLAHNDYAQLLMEFGVFAVVLAVALGALVVRQVRVLAAAYRQQHRMTSGLARRCYAGLGTVVFFLHSWVEFNMHIPALGICAAFLMGVFLSPMRHDAVDAD